MTFWTAVFTLFLVLDPLGNLPIVMALVKDLPERRRRWVVFRESLFALAVLVMFLFGGAFILGMMGVGTDDVRIAGGVVLFIIALRMIFPRPGEHIVEEDGDGDPFIVPLAVPLMAGPSAMATVILMRSPSGLGPDNVWQGLGAVLLAWGASCVILQLGPFIAKFLGPRVMRAIERLMGMMLIVISVHLLMTGIAPYLAAR